MTHKQQSNIVYNAIGHQFGEGELIDCLQCNVIAPYEITTINIYGIDISAILKPVQYDDPSLVIILIARGYHMPYHELPIQVIQSIHTVYKELVEFMNEQHKFFEQLNHPIYYAQSNYYVGQNKAYENGIDHVHGHVHVEFRTQNHEDQFTFAKHDGIRKIGNEDVRNIIQFVSRSLFDKLGRVL